MTMAVIVRCMDLVQNGWIKILNVEVNILLDMHIIMWRSRNSSGHHFPSVMVVAVAVVVRVVVAMHVRVCIVKCDQSHDIQRKTHRSHKQEHINVITQRVPEFVNLKASGDRFYRQIEADEHENGCVDQRAHGVPSDVRDHDQMYVL